MSIPSYNTEDTSDISSQGTPSPIETEGLGESSPLSKEKEVFPKPRSQPTPEVETLKNRSISPARIDYESAQNKVLNSFYSSLNLTQKFQMASALIQKEPQLMKELIKNWPLDKMDQLADFLLEQAQKYKYRYVNIVNFIHRTRPEIVDALFQEVRLNPKWTSHLRDKLFEEIKDVRLPELVLSTSVYTSYLPTLKPHMSQLALRFEDRSQLFEVANISQYMGPETEVQGIKDVLATDTLELAEHEKKILELLKGGFQEAGHLFFLNYFTEKKPQEREKLANLIVRKLDKLGTFPDDLLILSLGTSHHAITLTLFKKPETRTLTLLITNTSYDYSIPHYRKPNSELYSVTEQISEIPFEALMGEANIQKWQKLLDMRFDTEGSTIDQSRRFYSWVEESTGKNISPTERDKDNFVKWYPPKHEQYGNSCSIQSTRQANKYLITRMLWENEKNAAGPDRPLEEKDFWRCYSKAETLISFIDAALIKKEQNVEGAKERAIVDQALAKHFKKGTAVFNKMSQEEHFGSSMQFLDEVFRRIEIPFTPSISYSSKPRELQLKEKCKQIVAHFQSLDLTPQEAKKILEPLETEQNKELISVILARYQYKYNSFLQVRDLFHAAIEQKKDFTGDEVNFIYKTLNEWPEITAYELGELIREKVINEGSLVPTIEIFKKLLKGNRYFNLFSPLIKIKDADLKLKGNFIALMRSFTSSQRDQIRDSLSYLIKDPKLDKKINALFQVFFKNGDVKAKVFLITFIRGKLEVLKTPFSDEQKQNLLKFLLSLLPDEQEETIRPLIIQEGISWSSLPLDDQKATLSRLVNKLK